MEKIVAKEQPKMFLKSMLLEKKDDSNYFGRNIDHMNN